MNGPLLTQPQRHRLLDNWRANASADEDAELAKQCGRIVA